MLRLLLLLTLSVVSCKKTQFEIKDLQTGEQLSVSVSANINLRLDVATASNRATWRVTLESTKAIRGVETSDLVVENAQVSDLLKISDLEYTFLITPLSNGQVRAALSPQAIEKFLGDIEANVPGVSAIFDNTSPDVSLSQLVTGTTNLGSWSVELSTSEKLDQLLASDFDLVNCSISEIEKINDLLYRISINATNDGVVRIDLPNSKVLDFAGNNANNILGLSVIVDQTPPNVTIDNTPLGTFNVANIASSSLEGDCTSEDGQVSLSVGVQQFSLDCNADRWIFNNIASITNGENINMVVSQTDSTSNTGSVSTTFTKDDELPNLTLSNTPLAAVNLLNRLSYNLTGTCSSSDGNVSVIIDGNNFNPSCDSGIWNIADLSGLADGDGLAVTVSQTDSAGNNVTISSSIDKDIVLPSVTVGILSEDINISNQTSFDLNGSCTSTDGIVSIRIDGITFTTSCISNSWSYDDFSSVSDGTHDILIFQTDAAGNFGGAQLTGANAVTKKTSLPSIAIDSLSSPILPTTTDYTFSGTCSEVNENVVVKVSSLSSTVSCQSGGTWTATIDISSVLSDLTLNVEHYDSSENVSVASLHEFISLPQVFTSFNEIASNNVNNIFVIGSELYVSTPLGLSISYDAGVTFVTKSSTNGLGSNTVYSAFKTSDGKLFVATSGGLSISTDNARSFTTKTVADGLADNFVKDVVMDDNNILYAATSAGVSISSDFGENFTNVAAPVISNNGVRKLFVKGNKVYVCTSNGLSISTDGGSSFTSYTSFNSNSIWDAYEADDGTMYVATNSGLSISTDNGATFSTKLVADGLASSQVRSVIKDETNSILYVGTSLGISVSANNAASFSTKDTSNGLGSSIINEMSLKTDGSLYVATAHDFFNLGGLAYSTDHGENFTNIVNSTGLASTDIRDVFVDNTGSIYVSTWKGLSISEDGGASFYTYTDTDGLGSKNVLSTYVHNGIIYVATSGGGLTIITDDGSGGKTFTTKTSAIIGHNVVNDVFVDTIDSNTYVFLATNNGISVSNDGGVNFTNNTTPFGIAGVDVLSVFAKKVGANINIYATAHDTLSAKGGLAVSEDGGVNYTVLRSAQGLVSAYARDVFVDSVNKIYVATPHGVSVISDYGTPAESFQNSNTSNGMSSINSRSICVNSSGVMFVGTFDGGLNISSNDGNTYIVKGSEHGLPGIGITSLFCHSDGTVYTAGGGGISKSTPMLTLP